MNPAYILLIALPIIHILTLPVLLNRAGRSGWKGYVPMLNYLEALKVVGRPWYWIFLLVFPGVNYIVFIILHIELSLAFDRRSRVDQWTMGLLPWWGLVKLARDPKLKYVGKRDWAKLKKSSRQEWKEAIVWAVVVATIVRISIFEAFTIPTGSMEDSMLVGDYLVVSKLSYGARIPETPLTLPFMHNKIPKTLLRNSYVEWVSLPYMRLPGFRDVERYDAVVFNFPNGDTILVDDFLSGHDYHALLRGEALRLASGNIVAYEKDEAGFLSQARARLQKHPGLKARPVDKKENYVKRCVGMPGDVLSIVDRDIFIDGELLAPPHGVQFNYAVELKRQNDRKLIMAELNLTEVDFHGRSPDGRVLVSLRPDEVETLIDRDLVEGVEILDQSARRGRHDMYPNSNKFDFGSWDPDNFGPLQIPSAGLTIALTGRNIELYQRVITAYERHDFSQSADGTVLIDGAPATHYTFAQNYYWMMGDNRHGSADSRFWGFVPEDHVSGRATFTWFSRQNVKQHGDAKIRWNRMGKLVK
jgi:signal peptidase I